MVALIGDAVASWRVRQGRYPTPSSRQARATLLSRRVGSRRSSSQPA